MRGSQRCKAEWTYDGGRGHCAGGTSVKSRETDGENGYENRSPVFSYERSPIPEEWKKGVILRLYKRKGSRSDCKNYHGITLLSCLGKLFAHVLTARVKDKLNAMSRKEQSGFTPGRSTSDDIYAESYLAE